MMSENHEKEKEDFFILEETIDLKFLEAFEKVAITEDSGVMKF
jgi:hypothetical protein